jgi:hypothetical protein
MLGTGVIVGGELTGLLRDDGRRGESKGECEEKSHESVT